MSEPPMQELPHTTLCQAAPSRPPRLGTPPHRALSVPQTPWPSSKPRLGLRVRPPASAPLLLQGARLLRLPSSPTSPLSRASPCSLHHSSRPRYTSLLSVAVGTAGVAEKLKCNAVVVWAVQLLDIACSMLLLRRLHELMCPQPVLASVTNGRLPHSVAWSACLSMPSFDALFGVPPNCYNPSAVYATKAQEILSNSVCDQKAARSPAAMSPRGSQTRPYVPYQPPADESAAAQPGKLAP